MLERYLTIRQLYPQWFRRLDCEDADLAAIIDAGYLVPLPDRDDGRLVLFSCAGKFDPHKYTSAHMVKVHSLVTESLMDDEVNQINGYTYINDESGFQMAHISLWSLTDVRNILRCIQVGAIVRVDKRSVLGYFKFVHIRLRTRLSKPEKIKKSRVWKKCCERNVYRSHPTVR